MNTETKQPARGEYWEWPENEQRVVILQVDDGDIICRGRNKGDIRYWTEDNRQFFLNNFRHLPDCDSFDWKETVYPRYAVPKDGDGLFDNISYFIQESFSSMWNGVRINGDPSISTHALMHLDCGAWKLATKEEAEARHARLHREWVISQLVIIDRGKWPDHVPRPGVDWITANDVRGCIPIKSGNQPKNSELGVCFKIYCLPKDLPPEPVPASPPDRSLRTVELTVMMDGALVAVCRIPIIVDGVGVGVVSVQSTLHIDSVSINKQITRTVDLTDGVEEAF